MRTHEKCNPIKIFDDLYLYSYTPCLSVLQDGSTFELHGLNGTRGTLYSTAGECIPYTYFNRQGHIIAHPTVVDMELIFFVQTKHAGARWLK